MRFLSGIGFMGSQEGFNPLHDIDPDGLRASMDNYCRAHPLEPIARAAANFFRVHRS